jgi:hypothetical protein
MQPIVSEKCYPFSLSLPRPAGITTISHLYLLSAFLEISEEKKDRKRIVITQYLFHTRHIEPAPFAIKIRGVLWTRRNEKRNMQDTFEIRRQIVTIRE